MGPHTGLDAQKPRALLLLEHANDVVGYEQTGEAGCRLRRRERLDLQLVTLRRFEHAGDNVTVRWPEFQNPALDVERFAAGSLQILPKIVGAAADGYVVGVLKVGEANCARLTVRTPAVVCGRETVDPQYVGAALCQVVQSGTADATRTEHNAVVRHVRVRYRG